MPEPWCLRAAVFLDRDGTICEEVGYLNEVSRFRVFPFVPDALRRLNESGFPVIVVSNQSGAARGYFSEFLLPEVTGLTQQFAGSGARVDAVYCCSHSSSENCPCHKPRTGMLECAARDHAIDLLRSFVVGDRARNARARGVLVRTGYGEGELAWQAGKWPARPDFVADDLTQTVGWIVRQPR